MDVTEIKRTFRKHLHDHGLRYTPERDAIIDEVFSHERHFNADELFIKLKMKLVNVSRATVYRCLNLLESCNLVNRVSFGERHDHFEPIFKRRHHDHLICTRCGSVIEFYNEVIEKHQEQVCNIHDYIMTGHKLQIFGICPACREEI